MKIPKVALALVALLLMAAATHAAQAQTIKNLPTVKALFNCQTDTTQIANLASKLSVDDNGTVTFSSVTYYIAGSKIGSYTVPADLCQVVGYIGPADPTTSDNTGDSGNKFVMWLPLSAWTQRYVQEGCGGECGSANLGAPTQSVNCLPATAGELALATTDMGHQIGAPTWVIDNPWSAINFAYRGVHVTAQMAKQLIKLFYGKPAEYSYFDGCSDGGREALMEAQRYPKDFDGIAAGSPANNMDVQNTYHHAWRLLTNQVPSSTYPGYLPSTRDTYLVLSSNLSYINSKIIAACDGQSGVKDGMIQDPRLCHFDTNTLVCANNNNETGCLTQAQADAVFDIHDGAKSVNGVRLEPDISTEWGSERLWSGLYVPGAQGQMVGAEMFVGGWLYADFINSPYLDPSTTPPTARTVNDLDWTLPGYYSTIASSKLYAATNPDLKPFANHGGKLIFWAGWADQHISPQGTLKYWQSVNDVLGEDKVEKFARFYLFPAMGHCGGGSGPNSAGLSTFDLLTPLMAWVEKGNAPYEIVANGSNPLTSTSTVSVPLTRPVYPYPTVPRYSGHGDPNSASSFFPYTPHFEPGPTTHNAGDFLYKPWYPQIQCSVNGELLVCPADSNNSVE